MQWTQTQTEAIEKRNCNLLISAGAGSGKTAVLTERITRLIAEDRIEADRIVVLKEGRIAEIGTHAELLALNGIYAYLHQVQGDTPAPHEGNA